MGVKFLKSLRAGQENPMAFIHKGLEMDLKGSGADASTQARAQKG